MAGQNNVVFKFRIDLNQMTVEGEKAIKILDKIQRKSGEASRGITQLGNASAQTGQQTAASAVNFQTGTQGLLNLSTAAVQTYTSISNLDRANNRAKMSIIAVARAEDLRNNKLQRLNEMQAAGITSGNKYTNMVREIATAEQDLKVKQEKRVIEQSAVNDIYMLFATNIANVTISSMQTLAVFDRNQIMLTKAKIVVQKISNASMFTSAKASYAASVATALQGKAAVVTTGATVGLKTAVIGLTAATKAFMASNPLLLAAMAISTAAFVIHESNILNTKSALDEYIGVNKDFQTEVDEARNSTDKFNESLYEQENQLYQMPNTYSGIIDKLKELKDHFDGVTNSAKANTEAIINNQSATPSKGVGKRRFSSGGETSLITTQGIQGGLFQPAYASVAPQYADPLRSIIIDGRPADDYRNKGKMGAFDSTITQGTGKFNFDSKIIGFTTSSSGVLIPMGITGKQQAFNIIGKMRAEAINKVIEEQGVSIEEAKFIVDSNPEIESLSIEILESALDPQTFIDEKFIKGLRTFTPETHLEAQREKEIKLKIEQKVQKRKEDRETKIFTAASKAGLSTKEYKKRLMINEIAYKKLAGLTLNEDEKKFLQKGETFIEDIFVPEKVKQARLIRDRLKLGIFTDLPNDTKFNRLIYRSFGRKGGIQLGSDNPLLRDISDFGENRAAVFEKIMIGSDGSDMGIMGTDIGAVADSISLQDAMRFGEIQRGLAGFNYRPGQFALRKTGDTVSEIKAARAEREALITAASEGGRIEEVAKFIAQSGGVSAGLLAGLDLMGDKAFQTALGSGLISATDMYQNVSVATPRFILEAAAKADAKANRERDRLKREAKIHHLAQWERYSRLAGIGHDILGMPQHYNRNDAFFAAEKALAITADAGIPLTSLADVDRAKIILSDRHLKIATAAGITSAQADVLEDTELGRKEIEDRTRYHERLLVISSGDSSL